MFTKKSPLCLVPKSSFTNTLAADRAPFLKELHGLRPHTGLSEVGGWTFQIHVVVAPFSLIFIKFGSLLCTLNKFSLHLN